MDADIVENRFESPAYIFRGEAKCTMTDAQHSREPVPLSFQVNCASPQWFGSNLRFAGHFGVRLQFCFSRFVFPPDLLRF